MHSSTFDSGGSAISCRPDQRVSESDGDAELDESGSLRRVAGQIRDAELFAGCPNQGDVARGVRCRHQQPQLRFGSQRTHLLQIEGFEAATDRHRHVGQARLDQPLHTELVRQVDQSQRVAAGRAGDLGRHGRVDGCRQRGGQQRDGRFDGKAEDAQSRHPGQLGPEMVCVAGREDHCGCLCLKPAGHERQGVQRFGVEQVRIIDDTHHGPFLTRSREQAQHPQPDQEPIRWRPLGRTGRNPQRAPLPRWKQSQVGPERHHEPLQRRVGDGRLRLIAVSTQHIEPDQLGCRGGQQRRLSNAGLPRQQQSPTLPIPGMRKKHLNLQQLLITAQQSSAPAMNADSSHAWSPWVPHRPCGRRTTQRSWSRTGRSKNMMHGSTRPEEFPWPPDRATRPPSAAGLRR